MEEIEELERKVRKANIQVVNLLTKVGKYNALLVTKRIEAGLPGIQPQQKRGAEQQQPEVAAAPAPAKKKKTAATAAVPPKKAKGGAKSASAEADADFACAGNVVTGEPCPGTTTEPAKSKSSYGGKMHDSCKECKKAITKSRRKEE